MRRRDDRFSVRRGRDVPTVEHPPWCDLDICEVWPEGDGSTAVFHEVRLLDEPVCYPKRRSVALVRAVTLSPGGQVVDDRSVVHIHGGTDSVAPDDIANLAAALQLAAELIGYDQPTRPAR